MRSGLHLLAIGILALAVFGCGTPARLAVKLERIPCPPANLDVSSPSTGKVRSGETIEDYEDRVAADDAISLAAVRAWEEAHLECARDVD